jgi:mono/diheme cytochrome c family protein
MRAWLSFLFALLALIAAGCSTAPGKPGGDPEAPRPDSVMDFNVLYAQNCSACHGQDGTHGAAVSLADPEYMALADEGTLTRVITNGVRGTAMPGFAQSAGGMLTDAQVSALVRGMRARWAKPISNSSMPSYVAKKPADPKRGEDVYKNFCASCHEGSEKGTARTGAIRDPAYLSLVSDQGLRTLVIVGRPDWQAPDWRNDIPGRPLSEQQISDVVAWLAGQRGLNAATASSAGVGK